MVFIDGKLRRYTMSRTAKNDKNGTLHTVIWKERRTDRAVITNKAGGVTSEKRRVAGLGEPGVEVFSYTVARRLSKRQCT